MNRVLVLLGLLFFTAIPLGAAQDEPICKNPQIWFQEYNEEYFYGMLPANTIVRYGDAQGNEAITQKLFGRFYITLEPKYNLAPKQAHENILHESCHVLSWSELDDHGPRWRDCMDRLYQKGAFRDLL